MSDPETSSSQRTDTVPDAAYAGLLSSLGGRDAGGAETYFLKPGYRSRTEPAYFVDDLDDVVYQPDVYTVTALAARRLGATCIIDVGCGRAGKLLALAGEFETIGIDVGANIEYCRSRHPSRTWLACDLDRPHALPVAPEVLERSVIVCSDVVEHLVHPEHLLRSLAAALRFAQLGVLSTPERDLIRGVRDMGPPENLCHVREWNLAEFGRLLEHYGLTPRRIGLTRSDDKWEATTTILVFVAGSGDSSQTRVPSKSG